MKVPMFVAHKVLGRVGFSESRIQTDGYGCAVPFIRQKHANMCGDAGVEMLSRHFGGNLYIGMGHNSWGATDAPKSADVPNACGTRVRAGCVYATQALKDLLKRRGPNMCSGKFAHMGILGDQGHWILVKGADAGHFWTHDPWHGANV